MKEQSVSFDRTDFVRSHSGDNILPADPLFSRLLTLAHRPNPTPAIRDVNAGVEKTAAELLSDVLNFRRVLKTSLTAQTLDDLQNRREVYISIVAPGGYEFAVGMLAIMALGAAPSPFSSAQPVKEGCYYVNKARTVALVTATPTLKLGEAVAKEVQRTTNPDFVFVLINAIEREAPVPLYNIKISSDRYLDPNAPGLVIFTSGTTGPPKRRSPETSGFGRQLHGFRAADWSAGRRLVAASSARASRHGDLGLVLSIHPNRCLHRIQIRKLRPRVDVEPLA
jgi:malonyl-CoA/methylmalonyl-CoA synthetase